METNVFIIPFPVSKGLCAIQLPDGTITRRDFEKLVKLLLLYVVEDVVKGGINE